MTKKYIGQSALITKKYEGHPKGTKAACPGYQKGAGQSALIDSLY